MLVAVSVVSLRCGSSLRLRELATHELELCVCDCSLERPYFIRRK